MYILEVHSGKTLTTYKFKAIEKALQAIRFLPQELNSVLRRERDSVVLAFRTSRGFKFDQPAIVVH